MQNTATLLAGCLAIVTISPRMQQLETICSACGCGQAGTFGVGKLDDLQVQEPTSGTLLSLESMLIF